MFKREYFLKRPFDLILGSLGLFFSLPLWMIFIFEIWLEDFGPVFFLQERVGKDGKLFMNKKFRSMMVDAEKLTGPIQACENDARVTKIGRWLRRTAMDELPQLLNIIKGEMSFVGPRPLRPMEIEVGTGKNDSISDIRFFDARSCVKPGLTGVAQVFAARTITREYKFRYDLWYIDHQSFTLDVWLILLSVWISFSRKWDTVNKGFQKPL